MAKKSLIEREKKKLLLIHSFAEKRQQFKKLIKKTNTLDSFFEASKLLQQLPLNSMPSRHRNRCWKTGRARGYYRFFGVCRNILRENALNTLMPGVKKASW
jgi:small subunit ribosomal protein S14